MKCHFQTFHNWKMASALNTIMLPDLETSISNFHTTAKRDAACEEGVNTPYMVAFIKGVKKTYS